MLTYKTALLVNVDTKRSLAVNTVPALATTVYDTLYGISIHAEVNYRHAIGTTLPKQWQTIVFIPVPAYL